jgi:hypothetical protein
MEVVVAEFEVLLRHYHEIGNETLSKPFNIYSCVYTAWLRGYATSRKVTRSSPDEVIEFFSIGLILPAALCPWGRLSL